MFKEYEVLISHRTGEPYAIKLVERFNRLFIDKDLAERFIEFLRNTESLLADFLMSNDLLEITLQERHRRLETYVNILQSNKLYTFGSQKKLNELLALIIFHNGNKTPKISKKASLEDLRNLLVDIWMSRLPKSRQIQLKTFSSLKGLEKELYHFFLYSGPRQRLIVVDSLEEYDMEDYSIYSDDLTTEESFKINEWIDLMEYERVFLTITYKGVTVAQAWLKKDLMVEVFCFTPKLKADICDAIYEFIGDKFDREMERITFIRDLYDEEESFTRLRKQLAISRASGILPENYQFG